MLAITPQTPSVSTGRGNRTTRFPVQSRTLSPLNHPGESRPRASCGSRTRLSGLAIQCLSRSAKDACNPTKKPGVIGDAWLSLASQGMKAGSPARRMTAQAQNALARTTRVLSRLLAQARSRAGHGSSRAGGREVPFRFLVSALDRRSQSRLVHRNSEKAYEERAARCRCGMVTEWSPWT